MMVIDAAQRLAGAIGPLALLLATSSVSSAAPQATTSSCATDAATLVRMEADLPRIEVTSPADQPVLCITIETLMAFATRLKTHVAQCPNSNHATSAIE